MPQHKHGRAGGNRFRRSSLFSLGGRRLFVAGTLITVVAAMAIAALGVRARSAPNSNLTAARHASEIPPRPTFAALSGSQSVSRNVAELRCECFDVAEELVRTLPANPHALCLLGTVHHLFANDGEALKLWGRCLEIQPDFADAHLAMGHRAVNLADYAAAEEHFREAHRIDPAWDEVPLPFADVLLHQNKPDEAVTLLENFLRRYPQSPKAWCRLGKAYDQRQDYDNASRCYTRAVDGDPQLPDAHYGAGSALQKIGDNERAQHHFQRFRELQTALDRQARSERDEVSDETRLRLRAANTNLTAARVYFLHGRLAEAEGRWKRAATLDPRGHEARESLAEHYVRQGRLDEALALHEQLCELEPNSQVRWLKHGRLAYKHGRIDAAATSFQRAIALAPEHSEGYAFLAQVEAGRNVPEALRLARKAVELSPIAPHHFILSDCLWRAGDKAGCRAALEEAIRLDPAEPRYREAHARLGTAP